VNLPLSQIEGKYEILHKIKEGGMGAIYKVRHRLLEEVRVIKTIRPQLAEDADLRERFLREAKTAIRLRHPNIAQLYDFSVDADGTAYIVMEYIDGVTLQEMLAKSGPPPVPLTLELAGQALEALAYLHAQGFVHRDVAPDNLMLTQTFDGKPRVKLIDLGIAKLLEGGGGDLTATGTFLGKVRYAAPEVFGAGSAAYDARGDLYSFGVMLYELLTGVFPYRGESLSELMAGHLFRSPLGFDETDPDGRLPKGLRDVVLRILEKDPGERPGSAEEVASRLAAFRADPESLREGLDGILRTTTTLLLERGPVTRPGSTQGHLDRHFGFETTPAPETSAAGAGPSAARPRRVQTRAQEIAALLASARLLARLEQHARAKRELERLLELDPRSREGRELLETVTASLAEGEARRRGRGDRTLGTALSPELERELEKARRGEPEGGAPGRTTALPDSPGQGRPGAATAEAVRAIVASLERGDLERARRELEFARSLYGDAPTLDRVAEELARARAARQAAGD